MPGSSDTRFSWFVLSSTFAPWDVIGVRFEHEVENATGAPEKLDVENSTLYDASRKTVIAVGHQTIFDPCYPNADSIEKIFSSRARRIVPIPHTAMCVFAQPLAISNVNQFPDQSADWASLAHDLFVGRNSSIGTPLAIFANDDPQSVNSAANSHLYSGAGERS